MSKRLEIPPYLKNLNSGSELNLDGRPYSLIKNLSGLNPFSAVLLVNDEKGEPRIVKIQHKNVSRGERDELRKAPAQYAPELFWEGPYESSRSSSFLRHNRSRNLHAILMEHFPDYKPMIYRVKDKKRKNQREIDQEIRTAFIEKLYGQILVLSKIFEHFHSQGIIYLDVSNFGMNGKKLAAIDYNATRRVQEIIYGSEATSHCMAQPPLITPEMNKGVAYTSELTDLALIAQWLLSVLTNEVIEVTRGFTQVMFEKLDSGLRDLQVLDNQNQRMRALRILRPCFQSAMSPHMSDRRIPNIDDRVATAVWLNWVKQAFVGGQTYSLPPRS